MRPPARLKVDAARYTRGTGAGAGAAPIPAGRRPAAAVNAVRGPRCRNRRLRSGEGAVTGEGQPGDEGRRVAGIEPIGRVDAGDRERADASVGKVKHSLGRDEVAEAHAVVNEGDVKRICLNRRQQDRSKVRVARTNREGISDSDFRIDEVGRPRDHADVVPVGPAG